MKRYSFLNLKRCMTMLLSIIMVLSVIPFSARAVGDNPLTPDDLEYKDGELAPEGEGDIVLHKQAERIAADEWKVNVSAIIKDKPIEPPELEVTFIIDASSSMYACPYEDVHSLGMHTYHDNCEIICGNDAHEHEDSCYICGNTMQMHFDTTRCYYYDKETNSYPEYPTRFEVANRVITNMKNNLPEGTRVRGVAFNNTNWYWDVGTTITPQHDTKLMGAVRRALSQTVSEGENPDDVCFTSDDSKVKVLIIVTDGAATDGEDYGRTDTAFLNFVNNGGIVYTIGFNHDDENLEWMAEAGHGTYSQASNPDELETVFDNITMELTAMLIDPMGDKVGFVTNSVDKPATSVEGTTSFDSESGTLYWNPAKNADITNSKIEYSYTVKLDSDADMSAGVHSGVELNERTYLKYGITLDGVFDEVEINFPIPIAEYAVSTMQVKWMFGDTALKDPTSVESVICDYPGAAFETDYTTITPVITYGGKEYYYEKTVITKNGQTADSVVITDAAAYVVVHQYSEVKKYNVSYEYVGTVPAGAPSADSFNVTGLDAGEIFTVADNPVLSGYVFSGWSVAEGGVTIENNSFTMPANDVKIQGSWAKLNGYQVLVNYFTSTNGGEYKKDNTEAVTIVEETFVTDSSVDVDFSDFLSWNDSEYGEPKLDESSAAAKIEGNKLTEIIPDEPTPTVVLNLYRDVLTQAEVVVRYVDTEGNALRDDIISGSLYFGTEYDLSDAKIESIEKDGKTYDFVSDDDAEYTGTMSETGAVITRVYKERAKAEIIVHYVDEDGNTLREDTKSGVIYVGAEYDVSEAENVVSIEKDGKIYDFVSDDDAEYTGTMSEDGAVITRVYKERAKAEVIVHYVDESGNTLREDTKSGAIYVGAEYDVSAAEAVVSIEVDGKIYDFDSDDDAEYKGEVSANGLVITRVYKERVKAEVIVHYVDESGNALREDTKSGEIYVGAEYDVSAAEDVVSIEVDGKIFDFTDDDGAVYKGTVSEDGIEITRVYIEHGKETAVVHYVDESGNTLREDTTSGAVYVGSAYDVSDATKITSITKDGKIYDFVNDDSIAYKGTMPDAGVEITRVYKERAKAEVVVHYVDESGNTLREDTKSGEIYVGAEYDVSDAEDIESITKDGKTYDFTDDGNAAYEGEVPKDGIVITRVYTERKTTAPDDDSSDESSPDDAGDDLVATGDTGVGAWVFGCVMSAIVLLVLLIFRKRRYGYGNNK